MCINILGTNKTSLSAFQFHTEIAVCCYNEVVCVKSHHSLNRVTQKLAQNDPIFTTDSYTMIIKLYAYKKSE